MSPRTSIALALGAAIAATSAAPVLAQQLEGDTNSAVMRYARSAAEPGTFWLDNSEDREIIRYSTPRDVRLCLPRAQGVGAAERAVPIVVTWDQTVRATLYPGNCLHFDAKQVTLRPARELPSGVALTGHVETASALVG